MADADLTVRPLEGYPPAVGAALWMLEDTRRRTLDTLDGLADAELDQVPHGFDNPIGALLYHLAAIETDWLYADLLQQQFPDWVGELFPEDVRDEAGHLVRGSGASLDQHLSRLATVRQHLLEALRTREDEDFREVRKVESGIATPEWILHHLRQHEAEHRGQIQALRSALAGEGGP